MATRLPERRRGSGAAAPCWPRRPRAWRPPRPRGDVPVSVSVAVPVPVRRALLVGDRGAGALAGGAAAPLPVVEGERERVHHEREQGGEHGDERREGEVPPGLLGQARRGEVVEGVREHVHVPRGEDDPRREGLDDDEEVAVGPERGDGAGEERQAHADHAGHQDRRDGDQLQAQRLADVVARAVHVGVGAGVVGRGRVRGRRLRTGEQGSGGGGEEDEDCERDMAGLQLGSRRHLCSQLDYDPTSNQDVVVV